jgi:predicted nucleotidyltransferase
MYENGIHKKDELSGYLGYSIQMVFVRKKYLEGRDHLGD